MSTQHPFQDIETESRQPVATGNHDFFDSSVDRAVQKGEHARPFPVDSAGNIFDNSASRSLSKHIGPLSFEVIFLFVGRHSDVDDNVCWLRGISLFRFFCCFGFWEFKQSMSSRSSDAVDFAFVSPFPEGPRGDPIMLLDSSKGHIHFLILSWSTEVL